MGLTQEMSMQNILLAAGLASRSGGEKLFYPYGEYPLIHRSVLSSLEAGLFTVVVTGYRGDEVAAALADLSCPNLSLVHNEHYDKGQGGSTQVGVLHLRPHLPFFISLGDMPLIEARHYRALGAAYSGAPLRPRYGSKAGHPVLLPPSFIPIIKTQGLPFTMRELLRSHPMAYLDTTEEAYVQDVDTASAYHHLLTERGQRP